jgi:hypothetical protein
MGEKQITYQKWQEAITPEKLDVDGKAVGVWWDKYDESMDRLFMDEYDKRGERERWSSFDHIMRTINVGDIHHKTYR